MCFNYNRLPVDAEAYAHTLQLDRPIRICYSTKIPPQIGGYTLKTANCYYIMSNAIHPPRRQRFSICHELGHLYHHHQEVSIHSWGDYCCEIEQQADEFAAQLLMPENEIYNLAAKYTDILQLLNVTQRVFDVSLSAAAQRITKLNVFEGCIVLLDNYRVCFAYLTPGFEEEKGYVRIQKKTLKSGKQLRVFVAEDSIQI